MAAGEGRGKWREEGTDPRALSPLLRGSGSGTAPAMLAWAQLDRQDRTGKMKPSDEMFLPAAWGEEPSSGLASSWCLSAKSGLLVESTHRSHLLWGTLEVT